MSANASAIGRPRRYLVTGGAGFIGSHLCDHLIARGDAVHALDDLSTGSLENVAQLRAHPRFSLSVGSVLDETLLAEALRECDAVMHLAAAVGVRLIVESPVRTIETNVAGTETVLRLASLRGVPVLITSTSEVYGKSARVPFAEDADVTLGPTTVSRWSYACSKAVDEFLALAYWRERQLPVVLARLFNTVGPRQTGRYGMVLPRFVQQCLSGEAMTVYGDGSQTRCFAYVGDVVAALAGLIDEPRAYGEVFNVGNDEEVSVRELAERVRARVDPACPLRAVPLDEAYGPGFEDMQRRVPDLRKVRALLGHRQPVGLDEIIDRVIAWERARGGG